MAAPYFLILCLNNKSMKQLLIILFISCSPAILHAQQTKVVISYDGNGNRVRREIVTYKNAPANNDLSSSWELNAGRFNMPATFKVYPNPSQDVFNVAIDAISLKEKCELILIDQAGKELYRQVITQSVTPVSTRQFADGVYYIVLYSGDKKENTKVVKITGIAR
jgi:hypothetical protein